jgi:hypothetical protein
MEYRVSPDVLSARLASETVLLDMRTKNYFQLNATAARMWDSLERGRSMEEIVAELGEAYAAPLDQVEVEAQRLLDALVDRQLVLKDA